MFRTLQTSRRRALTAGRAVALVLVTLVVAGLSVPALTGLRGEPAVTVPAGARAGSLTTTPCTYDTDAGALAADCGTLVVPENRQSPGSRLIALPVVRIRSTAQDPAEPVFRLGGGPGASNLDFPEASRLTDRHDVVLVGYRGVEGSTVLDCPEVDDALRNSPDMAGAASMRRVTEAFATCSRRLTAGGVDLPSYSFVERVDDLEAARTAFGYERLNLFSSSAGTRIAMIYAWRYPASILRSAMFGVNPPGRFVWDPEITDRQLAHYADLCRRDDACGARTGDLAASMRETAADLPGRWGPLRIKNGNVRAATMFGMFQTTDESAPLNAPTMIDAWLRGADGDASGFWAMSTLADLAFPGNSVWGEFAASGMIDAAAMNRYYAEGGDPGSTLGNAAADLLLSGGGLPKAWPASRGVEEYQQVRPSAVETLVISGTVDLTTPAELATDEFLPSLSRGHQVRLPELGHTADFWAYQPEAGRHLLSAFYERGAVDDSRYVTQPVDFEAGTTMATIAKVLVGITAGGALLALALLAGMVRRVRRRGAFGRRTGVALRVVAPLVLGLGGWFLAMLAVWTVWPATFVGSWLVTVPPIGLAAGLGVHRAWVHRDWSRAVRLRGLGAALAGGVLGACLGFAVAEGFVAALTTVVGATAVANGFLVVTDVATAARQVRRVQARPAG
jgi:pimeloyl-ACP methyl ester carboxylesterase